MWQKYVESRKNKYGNINKDYELANGLLAIAGAIMFLAEQIRAAQLCVEQTGASPDKPDRASDEQDADKQA